MNERQRIFEEVCRHCDLRERLTLVPPSAKVRGLYIHSVDTVLARHGKADEYRALFPERFAAILWHPASEFLVRLAVGAALLTSPERVHEGMFEIGRRNAVAFSESLLGRTVMRLLSRDPRKLLQQGLVGKRQGFNQGSWSLEFPTECSAIVTMIEEYVYIESYTLGAAQGTFDMIGVPVRAVAVLDDRFNGRHLLDWG